MEDFDDDAALDAGDWDRRFARVLAKVAVDRPAVAIIDANGADGGVRYENIETYTWDEGTGWRWAVSGAGYGSGCNDDIAYASGQADTDEEVVIEFAGQRHHGVGLAFLATIRNDGAPRLHPVCPVIDGDGLYVFIGNHSPKVHDLLRDGRFALHSFPIPEKDDEFSVAGHSRVVNDDQERSHVYDTYTAQGTFTTDDTLFELLPERALHSAYEARGSWPPTYTKWRA